MKNTKKLKNAYKAPQLKVYGGMTKLTAAGSTGNQETKTGNGGCSNNKGPSCLP